MPTSDDDISQFYRIARMAAGKGLLTWEEIEAITQKGRKNSYWARHLRNLKEIVSARIKDREGMEAIRVLIEPPD